MSIKPVAGAVALALTFVTAMPAAAAESTTANLGVTAVVADTCILTAGTALAFATINTTQASNETVPGLVTVVCTATRPGITVTLGSGENASGGKRQMESTGGDMLPYDIFTDSGHSSAVAVDGKLYDGAVNAAIPVALPVYGQIPAGNYNAGAYTDTILVTLSY
ncbi:spore coat U domain-containing protein [Salipiger sp.]|uniref:Csu type fimbrial protein n=1 Tax=Salipiger sp. TaxID=2078585 RepID=UPI003A985806